MYWTSFIYCYCKYKYLWHKAFSPFQNLLKVELLEASKETDILRSPQPIAKLLSKKACKLISCTLSPTHQQEFIKSETPHHPQQRHASDLVGGQLKRPISDEHFFHVLVNTLVLLRWIVCANISPAWLARSWCFSFIHCKHPVHAENRILLSCLFVVNIPSVCFME